MMSLSLFGIFLLFAQGFSHIPFKRVCYFTNWAQYRPDGARFIPINIDPFLCTHIIYAFAQIDSSLDITTTEGNDLMRYSEIMKLKDSNPDLKIMIALGGNGRSDQFISATATTTTMQTFANKATTFMRTHGFDGIDIDWEFPSYSGRKDEFTLLLQTLRNSIETESLKPGQKKLLLSFAASAGKAAIDNSYDIPSVDAAVDFISVMAYDFSGVWNNPAVVRHNSPLYPNPTDTGVIAQLNSDWAMQYWLSGGANASKLVLGLATYGRSFTLADPSLTTVGSPFSGPGLAGTYTRENGVLSYYEVCKLIETEGWTSVFLSDMKVPYAYGVRGGNTEWVGYDDSASFVEKLNYVRNNGFGGAMVWSLSFDDFDVNSSFCSSTTTSFPVISKMRDILKTSISAASSTSKTSEISTTVTSATSATSATSSTISPTSPTSSTSEASPSDVAALETTCANGEWTYNSLKSNCSIYYMCSNGRMFKMSCAAGLVFDVSLSVCNWPANVPGCNK